MGLVNGVVTLRNPRRTDLKEVEVVALADSGSVHLCITEHVRIQLELETIRNRRYIAFVRAVIGAARSRNSSR